MDTQALHQAKDPDEPGPLPVEMLRLIEIGQALWAVALVVVLAVPDLHTGSRDWWPWVPVAGLVLGGIGWLYMRRGRGNAAEL